MSKKAMKSIRETMERIVREDHEARVASAMLKINKMRKKTRKYPRFDEFRYAMAQLIRAGWADNLEDDYEIVRICEEA